MKKVESKDELKRYMVINLSYLSIALCISYLFKRRLDAEREKGRKVGKMGQ